ncbi:RHS repeat domain-containing protein [Aeromonas popoffii]|uniref:RHS repeat domain-containing protein n=1 Tax=Aeromonas popoffii TaxID=70856 RepID=UPI0030D51F00
MHSNNTTLFAGTPDVTILDNRGLSVRDIRYHRHPDTPDRIDEQITRHVFTTLGHLQSSTDPRLHASGVNNFEYQTTLSGQPLLTSGMDNGTTVTLNDIAGRSSLGISATGVVSSWQYEDDTLPGRPLSLTERAPNEGRRVTERFIWAGNSPAEQNLNLAGQCLRHYDTAGLSQVDGVGLTGAQLSVSRQLLQEDVDADWQGSDESTWQNMLAPEVFTTQSTADATGVALTTTDAKGNVQRMAYDVAGLLSGSWLILKSGIEQVIVKSLTYSAAGQKLREEHGNGVVTRYSYEPETQRLIGIKTERPTGHNAGTKILQDLRYEYDPVGNVLKISNDAEEARFWRNQKVVPENTYTYDSLYQLVSATGREMANAGQQGCNLPSTVVPLPTDSSTYTNYTRTYAYDNAGNLTQIRHSAPATNNSYTANITISDRGNRGVLSTLTENPADVDKLFTTGGQQKQLLPGQALSWTPRNELLKVMPVVRDGSTDDRESYCYDAGSQRILKVSTQKTNNSTQTQRVVYLPGLELRSTTTGSTETGSLQVITMGEAGRAQVRVLHWNSGRPADINNDQVRYSYDNLIGSSGLELDKDGNVISLEEYYPYGGTAVWTARSAVEANYKTVRYSGKERDATGLYYYGYRYYQPWAGRWLSADPAGTVDGLNLFRMVQNKPVTCYDGTGESTQNRNRNIFRLVAFGLHREGEGMAASLSRGKNLAFAIAGGLAFAGMAVTVAITAGLALGVVAAIGAGAFAIGAIAGWNINKITSGVAKFISRRVQGKSVATNAAAGAGLGSATAHLTGARMQGTAIAGIAGGVSGAMGGVIANSDRGMGGAHAAGVAVGTVNTMAGSDVSYAMEVTSATFGAIGGFITGTHGSTSVGENTGYGSYIGGMVGRYADNAVSYTFNIVGGEIARRGVQSIITNYVGNNFLTRFVGRRLGGAVFSFLRRNISVGGSNEWVGSSIGAAVGGVGTALSITAPDAHLRTRINQLGSLVNYVGGWAMTQLRSFVLPAAARNVAIDAGTSAIRLATKGASFA